MLERAPVEPAGQQHVLFEQFWLQKGPVALPEQGTDGELTLVTVNKQQAMLSCAAELNSHHPGSVAPHKTTV